jgi:hypothetical protein
VVWNFDRYNFADTYLVWQFLPHPHGIFVFRGIDEPPENSVAVIRYPDGSPAYKIVVK